MVSAGTLKAAIIGLLVVVGLAVLNAFSEAKFETWGLVAIAVVVLMGSVAFSVIFRFGNYQRSQANSARVEPISHSTLRRTLSNSRHLRLNRRLTTRYSELLWASRRGSNARVPRAGSLSLRR
jgi:uncharacterized membrane protein